MSEWKLVPVEPTEEMLEDGRLALMSSERVSYLWSAMLDAAPPTELVKAAEEAQKLVGYMAVADTISWDIAKKAKDVSANLRAELDKVKS